VIRTTTMRRGGGGVRETRTIERRREKAEGMSSGREKNAIKAQR
jgi:hypothetical protein